MMSLPAGKLFMAILKQYCIETIMFDSTVPRDNMLAKL